MRLCDTCGNDSTMEVQDSVEVKAGVFAPIQRHGGCDKHPALGLQLALDGTTTVVVPTGWVLSGHTLVKNG